MTRAAGAGPAAGAATALAALVGAAALGGCPSDDPRAVFERDVVPVLERTCAASTCHGVAPGAEADGEVIDRSQLFFDLDRTGGLADVDAAYATSLRAIDPTSPPVLSSLIRKPLAEAWGGSPHRGGDNFFTADDEALLAIAGWIELEDDGGESPAPLSELEQRFADEVQPALFAMGCASGNCHGPTASNPYHLDPGVAGVFGVAETRANYTGSRRMLSLTGDGSQSRLLVKALPLHAGGIVHKGGNSSFLDGPSDERGAAIAAWACAEREAATGLGCAGEDEPVATGIVFVRGPLEAGHPFDLDRFAYGSDLWLLPLTGSDLLPGEPVNLTAGLHDGPVDIRDPAVDATGTRVVFAMRTAPWEGHSLWELRLDTGDSQRLTDPGTGASDRDPTWLPDGTIWFASTRAREAAHAGTFADADLYELDPDTGDVRRRTWTPHAERTPVMLTIGKVEGEVAFSTLRDTLPGEASGQLFRFPPDLKAEYHIHFGITPPEDLFLGIQELPDGRYATTAGDLGGVWDAGRIGILDRNFGPEIVGKGDAAPDPALPFYAPPLVRLDPGTRAVGTTPRLVREVTALPDGRLVAAAADGPVDLGDPDAVFDLRIELITLAEGTDGSGPAIASRTTLADAPGVHDSDPQPVFVRPTEERHLWEPVGDTGLFLHNGIPMNDAILASLEPAGPKPLDPASAVGVRLVEALPLSPDDRFAIDPADTRDGHAGATSTGLGPHPPARVLAELPLAADGTFAADVPAGVPFRIQTLDERGMATGAIHNRWYDIAPGQVIKQGVGHGNPRFYGASCAGCHGSLDGDPASAFVEPDVMTTATVTLSRFENADPRRPIPPAAVGDATRFGIDFRDDVQPLLTSACATSGCHDGAAGGVGPSLTDAPTVWFNDAYESLLEPGDGSGGGFAWVDAGDASAASSHLVELLLGTELDAPAEIGATSTPHGDLTDEEIELLVRWIELGATYVGEAP